MSEEDEPMPGIEAPGAMVIPDIDEDEVLALLGLGELPVHGGGVTHFDWSSLIAEEDAAAVGLLLVIAVAAADGVAVTGATVVAPPIGTPAGAPAGGAPAGGTPAPAVEDVESLPDFRPISDRTTARSTIATSAPMTQAVLFGLSLSGPDWSSDVVSVGVSAMMFSRWRTELRRNAMGVRVREDHSRRKDLVWFHMYQ
jgi:hypothetical protein